MGPLYFVDFRVDWAGFEQIDGDFRSNSFGGSVKRNDSIIPKKYDLARFNGRVTERTFYGVSTLSGLPLRKTFTGVQAAQEGNDEN